MQDLHTILQLDSEDICTYIISLLINLIRNECSNLLQREYYIMNARFAHIIAIGFFRYM